MGFRARKYIGNFLKQEDVPEQVVVTIISAEEATLPEGGVKPSVKFAEYDKPMLLNPTNLKLLIDIFGNGTDDDSDRWIGQRVVLYVDPHVTYGTLTTGGLRLRAAGPYDLQQAAQRQPQPVTNGQVFPAVAQ